MLGMPVALLFVASAVVAQEPETSPSKSENLQAKATASEKLTVTLPAGTRVLLALKSPISTKSAQPGNGVYLETTFPVTIDNKLVIPPGTFVQGVIDKVVRPGRVKGRAQLQMHFTSMIFPSGYTVAIPGALDSAPSAESENVKGQERTIQEKGQKGQDAASIAAGAGAGAAIGALSAGGKGAGIGAGIGAAASAVAVLLTRGNDVRLDVGSPIEMVLQRPLTLEQDRAEVAARPLTPVQGIKPMEKPAPTGRDGIPVPYPSPYPTTYPRW